MPLSTAGIFGESGICSSLRCLRTQTPSFNLLRTTTKELSHRVQSRTFTSTSTPLSWLQPRRQLTIKDRTGRPRMPTGGSTRGTTVIWGDFGLRLRDHDRRISAAQLKNGEDVIRRRMRGVNYRLMMRLHTNVAVYKKGNESRMGTGKGRFDHWAARVPISRIVFELSADCHEQVIRDAMRLAANKLPGLWEFVKKGDPPMMGLTKLGPETLAEDLMRPRKKLPGEDKASRLPGMP